MTDARFFLLSIHPPPVFHPPPEFQSLYKHHCEKCDYVFIIFTQIGYIHSNIVFACGSSPRLCPQELPEAQAIFDHTYMSHQNTVTVDCGAVKSQLFQSPIVLRI